jgi:hypothetical protein
VVSVSAAKSDRQYLEPWSDYFARKLFVVVLASSSLIVLAVVDLVVLRDHAWSLALAAINGALLGETAILLLVERRVLRYRRFEISDRGFVLPGANALPDGTRLVQFSQVVSAEGTALPLQRGNALLSLRLMIMPLAPGVPGSSDPIELVILPDELRHRSIVRLWQALVDHGAGSQETLDWIRATR